MIDLYTLFAVMNGRSGGEGADDPPLVVTFERNEANGVVSYVADVGVAELYDTYESGIRPVTFRTVETVSGERFYMNAELACVQYDGALDMGHIWMNIQDDRNKIGVYKVYDAPLSGGVPISLTLGHGQPPHIEYVQYAYDSATGSYRSASTYGEAFSITQSGGLIVGKVSDGEPVDEYGFGYPASVEILNNDPPTYVIYAILAQGLYAGSGRAEDEIRLGPVNP